MQFLYSRPFELFLSPSATVNHKSSRGKKTSILTSLENINCGWYNTVFCLISRYFNKLNIQTKKLTVLTVNALRLPFFLSHLSFSCSSLRMKVCGTSFSFSWGTWFGSLEYGCPPCSPLLWWRFPPFPQCWHSASTPRCSDPRPTLPDGLSH